MPNNATHLYHKHPDLQIVLDFLGRCVPNARQMVTHYDDAHALEAVKAVCAKSNIHPVNVFSSPGPGGASLEGEDAQSDLTLDREDWLALAGNAMSLLAQELRLRLPAVDAALKLVPVDWDALALADSALAAWGIAEGMIALPGPTVFAYLGSRYPSGAQQRGKYAIVRDVEHAAACRKGDTLGFLLAREGVQNFACSGDDWRREMASARSLLNDHLSLMLKIGLQMLEAGATDRLKDMHSVLALAGEAPSLVRLQTLLETYEHHVASYGAGQNRFRNKLLENCLKEFRQWGTNCSLVARAGPGVAYHRGSIGAMRKWMDSGVAAGARRIPVSAAPAPCTPPATTSTSTTADPMIADGVTIPKGVTVARGARVRVCAVSPSSRLRPGTVLHGDVSIASHTRFDGPLTIMNDVRIGWGLTFGPGLILIEGATVSAFTVKCRLPHGTRIAGSLRIGDNSTVDNNVSFGAENWIGEHVHIGENVRFGPYVQVDSGVSIGANAWIKSHVRLIGNVPENARVVVQATGSKRFEQRQAGPAYAVKISAFTITKNEGIRDRPAVQRTSLASELDIDNALQDDSPIACPDAPTGAQRKRGGDILVGHTAKRLRTGLESRYEDAKSDGSPVAAKGRPDDSMQKIPSDLSRLSTTSAFRPVQPTASSAPSSSSSSTTTTTTTATAWLNLQRPTQCLPGTALIVPPLVRRNADGAPTERHQGSTEASAGTRQAAPAKPHAPDVPLDREAQRSAWQKSMISKENQSALERGMRQSIRVPTVLPRDTTNEPMPGPIERRYTPMYAIRGLNL